LFIVWRFLIIPMLLNELRTSGIPIQ
jgi:hypothetical protein